MKKIFKLTPVLKEAIWGGTRLFELGKGKSERLSCIAESWELSFIEGSEAQADGIPISKLIPQSELYSEGTGFGAFPVLTKFIDARDNLSVQVHPSDEYALKNEGMYGKTEAWYVVDCDEGAGLYLGFDRRYTKDEVREAVVSGEIEKMLSFKRVKPGDFFFIPAGTVHAIGKGVLIFEIQQSSTLTYRLYDYKRRDSLGRERELHLDKALEVLIPDVYRNAEHPDESDGARTVAKCDYFFAREYTLSGADAELAVSDTSFLSLTAVAGELTVTLGGESLPLATGETALIKRGSGLAKISGYGKIIAVSID